jgi:alginate O-acetyltransferase complex protein AlgI
VLFVTARYFIFLFAVLIVFYTLPASWRKYLLLAASYFFYMSWNWKFLPFLLLLTLIDYSAAIWIARNEGAKKRAALIVSLAANLSFLGVFKYYNFAAANIAWLLGRPEDAFFRDIVLPLGISFHTFQSISYVVDVYRGQQIPIRRFTDYALFIAFFPQLVAGPIVRAETFFADFHNWRNPITGEVKRGAFLLIQGLFKKLVLADNFAVVSDRYFGAIAAQPGSIPAWGGIVAFAIEIFFDFSGYSDMAIGAALLLGFHFPQNFRQPFLSISVTDFWRRWHITLSNWLRDYLYFPLGGSRHGRWNTYRNLILTMLLGGLWHGARWGFVTWGLFNGVFLAIERATGLNRIRDRPLKIADTPFVILNFAIFCVGVVFVRANTMRDAFHVIQWMFSMPSGSWPIETTLMVLLGASLLIALFEDRGFIHKRVEDASVWTLGACLGTLLFLVEVLGQHQNRPFYYFQF